MESHTTVISSTSGADSSCSSAGSTAAAKSAGYTSLCMPTICIRMQHQALMRPKFEPGTPPERQPDGAMDFHCTHPNPTSGIPTFSKRQVHILIASRQQSPCVQLSFLARAKRNPLHARQASAIDCCMRITSIELVGLPVAYVYSERAHSVHGQGGGDLPSS